MPYWMRYKYSHRHKAGKNIIIFVFTKIVNIVEKKVLLLKVPCPNKTKPSKLRIKIAF
jgi:hypothetical protein